VAVVVFDALGTLLELEPVRRRFVDAGAPPGALEAWVERILHTGASLTLLGDFHPFAELAESTLPTVLAQAGLGPGERGPLEALREEIAPYRDAAAALDVLDGAGVEAWILTNGADSGTRDALRRGGLEDRISGIVSIDDVRAFKPHRAAYAEAERRIDRAPDELWLIAAHAWDVLAGRTYGWHAVWIDRLERAWPLPHDEPEHRASDLASAARVVAAATRP
jgi:2-haloacid dehalogenase